MDNKLIEENLEFVRGMACKSMKYVPDEKKGMVSYDDLFSAGCVGLVEAAKMLCLSMMKNWIELHQKAPAKQLMFLRIRISVQFRRKNR